MVFMAVLEGINVWFANCCSVVFVPKNIKSSLYAAIITVPPTVFPVTTPSSRMRAYISAKADSAPDLFVQPPKIQTLNATIRNGKRVSGIATRVSQLLNRYGIEIENAANYPKGYESEQTRIIYADDKWKQKVIPSIELIISGKVEHMDALRIDDSKIEDINSEEVLTDTMTGDEMIQRALGSNDIVIVIGNDFSDYLSAK